MLIRLVVLHQHERLTDNQSEAIVALESHKTSIEQSEGLDWAAIKADIKLVKEATKDDMSERDLEGLYWRVNINFLIPDFVCLANPCSNIPTDPVQPAQHGFPNATNARKLPRSWRSNDQPFLLPECPPPLGRT